MKSIKAIFRRGQTSNKLDGQIHTPESLSRSSSVTNLNVVDQSTPKVKGGGTKPRKSASRDKLDKIGTGTATTERKNERKGVTKNNNKFDSGDTALAIDSLQEIESLRAQLHQMATEKSNLALELGEQKGHIHSLQHQIENLKMYQEQSSLQLEQLTEENTVLRNRLRDVAHSPLSDNEKQQLLYESHRHHNSAPASIATNPLDDGTCGDVTACPTPDWDKHSSSNVSEVSVACLQDKINQMQETHYSTNEELQATLQELTDLQKQLTELQQENERLSEEKNLMFDSLCRQTERLKDTRQEVESLKTLLYREKNEPGVETAQEREEKLVDLLKSAQDEHESLLSKHEQMSVELQELRDANEALHEQLKVLTDRNVTLESTLDAKHAEHKLLDQELAIAKDQSSGRQIEINRLKDLLENARTKIGELEQDRALSDKSELDELLDNARKEKDSLESEVTHLKDQLARSKNEIEKLKEQVSILQEECKVTRNNARTIQSDLEYKFEKLMSEKTLLTEQLHNFQDVINELQVQAQCQVEDKRNLSDVLAETQRNLSESERRIISLQSELADVKKLRKDENEEWEKFQNDLLTSVRVANDFKTEAQQDLQKMIMENKEHRDKLRQLEAQLDKLKGDSSNSSGMPEGRRNSQPFFTQHRQKGIFGSLPNLLDSCGAEKGHTGKKMKRLKGVSNQKQLSLEEGKILDSLDRMYKEIDPSTPEEQLTTEQVVIRKLKTLYEDQSVSYRPIAPRNKGDLAISKPLLESVYSNPKLETIAKNPDLKCLEGDRFSWLGHKKFTDEELVTPEGSPRMSSREKQENRSSSHSNVGKKLVLKRYSSKEDLSELLENEEATHKTLKKKIAKKRSSLKSNNSESSSNYSQKKRVSFDEKRNSCFMIKEFLTHESLEDIYKTIDPKVPVQQLTKEQRFALRVKTSCYNLGEKSELRKRHTFRKNKVTISLPTRESVLRNTKLCSIINDPIVRTVGEFAEEQETVELRNLKRMRKYLADTNIVIRNSRQDKLKSNLCKNDPRLSTSFEDIGRRIPFRFDRPFSSMENLLSEPTDQSRRSAIQIDVTTNVLQAKSFASSFIFSSSSSSVDNSVENLLERDQETPVIFVEHFEPEIIELRKRDKVEIREMSANSIIENSQLTDEVENTGRISFPNDGTGIEDQADTRKFSVTSAEIDDLKNRLNKRKTYERNNSSSDHFAEEGKHRKDRVKIREISMNSAIRESQFTDAVENTGRISFPNDGSVIDRQADKRNFFFTSVEIDHEDNSLNKGETCARNNSSSDHFVEEGKHRKDGVKIREISMNSVIRDSQFTDEVENTGRISFPNDGSVIDRQADKRIFFFTSVEIDHEDNSLNKGETCARNNSSSDHFVEEGKHRKDGVQIREISMNSVIRDSQFTDEVENTGRISFPNDGSVIDRQADKRNFFFSSVEIDHEDNSLNKGETCARNNSSSDHFVEEGKHRKDGVKIREISMNSVIRDSQFTDEVENTGRISFPNDGSVIDRQADKRNFFFSSVEIDHEDNSLNKRETCGRNNSSSDHFVEERKHRKDRVQIREISMNSAIRESQFTDEVENTGRISFPNDDGVPDNQTDTRIRDYLGNSFEVREPISEKTKDEEMLKKDRVEIREIFVGSVMRNSQSTDKMGYTGRISFPVEDEVINAPTEAKKFTTAYIQINDQDNSLEERQPFEKMNHTSDHISDDGKENMVHEKSRVEIREIFGDIMKRNSQLTEEVAYTGRISFPNDEVIDDRIDARLNSEDRVEIDDQYGSFDGEEPYGKKNHTLYHISENENDEPNVEEEVDFRRNEILKTENLCFSDDGQRGTKISNISTSIISRHYSDPVTDETEYAVEASGYLSNRISDISCESWEGEEKKEVKSRYNEVVQEIKRKYSLHCPSDSSDEEEINIFTPRESRIEVKKFSREYQTTNDFLDSFFNASNEISSQNGSQGSISRKNYEDVGKSLWEETPLINIEESKSSGRIQGKADTFVPLEEKAFIRYIRQEHEEDFKKIDSLGYVNNKNNLVENSVAIKSPTMILPEVNISDLNKYSHSVEQMEEKSSIDDIKENSELLFDISKRAVDNNDFEITDKPRIRRRIKEQFFSSLDSYGSPTKSCEGFDHEISQLKFCTDNKSSYPKLNKLADEEELGKKLEHLSKSELNLVSALRTRDSRPVSAINFDDIAFIESMKSKYLNDEYSKDTEHSNEFLNADEGIIGSFKLQAEQVVVPLTTDKTGITQEIEQQFLFMVDSCKSHTHSSKGILNETSKLELSTGNTSIVDKKNNDSETNELFEEDGQILQQLSKSEINLVPSLNKRDSRPLSAINIDDIAFIEDMKSKYLNDECSKKTEYSRTFFHADGVETVNESFQFMSGHVDFPLMSGKTPEINFGTEGDESYSDNLHLGVDRSGGFSEETDKFLVTERNNCLPSSRIISLKLQQSDNNKSDEYEITSPEIISTLYSKKNGATFSSIQEGSTGNVGYRESEFVSKQELKYFPTPKNPSELQNLPLTIGYRNKISSIPLSTGVQLDTTPIETVPYEAVYENYYELKKKQLRDYENIQRKPKPLPRNLHSIIPGKQENVVDAPVSRSKMNLDSITVKPENFDCVNSVKIENHEPLPNYSEVMERTDDGMKSRPDNMVGRCVKSYSNTTKNLGSSSKIDTEIEESTSEFVSDTLSSNILIRRTKKFIKDGNQLEEFDETSGVSNIELENLRDLDKFDMNHQLIPEDLIDYADSESKITLFNNDSSEKNEYFEPCSRPQTSRQASTSFRLSCYGGNSNDSIDLKIDASPRRSRDIVTQLKEKFETLADERSESKRNSVIMREYAEARKSNLPKLFQERDTYDLVFKTNSKYWFDNNSELDKSDATIQSTPSFEPSNSTTPLNITILDPVESKTNTDYQHLFTNDPLGSVHKPFVEASQLSELNLKTSIPCVDFTTLPIVEKGSNASLFNFIHDKEPNSAGKSDGEKIGRFATNKPT